MNRLILTISLLIMGFSGIIAQIILLRELLISFLGNELTLGIILANWLILEAIGSFFIGKTVEKTIRKIEVYALLQLIFAVVFPIAIYFSRIVKNIFLATPGEALGFFPIFYSSWLILMPVSISHGALFTYGCKLYSQIIQKDASSVGKVYVMETIGSIIGGSITTFFLIQYLNSFEIAFAVSLSNSMIALFLLRPNRWLSMIHFRNWPYLLSIVLTLLFSYSLLSPISKKIHLSSISSQWKGLQVIHNENSIYGNITVTQRGEQFTFFTDGIPFMTTPVPDVVSIEDFVHFPMLFHPDPESVLVLSGGAGGMIQEILKYPIQTIDYVELDPLLLKLVQKYSTPLTQSELSDKRVRIHYTDGRFFIKRTINQYDIIFIGLSAPQELQTNRLFSFEFFSMAKRKMKKDGIIVLSLPGSLTYISPSLRDLNGCILDTLKSVYNYLRIIPGEANLYLASDSDQLEKVTAQEILRRFEERKIKASLFTKKYIDYRLNEGRIRWFLQSMQGRKVNINSDFRPLSVFFNLTYWNTLFSPYLARIFKWFEGLSLYWMASLIAILILLFSILFIKRPTVTRFSLPYSIFTSGITDMMLELAIILTFQALYGYLYYQIGLLLTLFMVGVALSSHYMTRQLDRIEKHEHLFLMTEFWVIVFSLFLPFVFSIPSDHIEKSFIYVLLYGIFLIMSLLCGTLVGLQFPLATKIYLNTSLRENILSQTAGLLYGADLFGGFFGGLLGGVLFLPLLGLKNTCFLMVMIKISSGFLFSLFMKTHKTNSPHKKGA